MEPEIKAALDELQRAWVEFRTTNDTRLKELEKKGVADPLLQTKLEKLNTALDTHQQTVADHLAKLEGRVNDLRFATGPRDQLVLTPDQLEYRKSFDRYLRKGLMQGLDELQTKAMSEGTDPAGGYLVLPDTRGHIVTRVFESSPIRQIAAVQPITTDALEGILDLEEADAGWVAEKATRTTTTTPGVKKYRVPVHEGYAQPAATQGFLDDASINVEQWLANKVADKKARMEATAFVTGNGAGKPRGFASYVTAATADASRAWGTPEHVATGTAGGWGTAPNGSDKLIDLVSKLNPIYLGNARFAMSRGTQASARTLKANNAYIWLPTMAERPEATLLGYPITLAEDMPAYTTTDALAIAFGDFRAGYQVADRQDVRTLRDPYTVKGYVLFYSTFRVGGDIVDFNAIKFLKFGTS